VLYLLANITGRFSVAIFGLTYNLVDAPVGKTPILATNWTSSVLIAKNATDFEVVEQSHSKDPAHFQNTSFSQQLWLILHVVSYLDLVRGGLATLGRPDIRSDISVPQNLTLETLHSLRINSSFPVITGGNVSLTYHIRDFADKARRAKQSGHAVYSSASCGMFRLDGDKYWKDYGSDNQTSKGMLYQPHGRTPTECVVKFTLILETDWTDERNRETIAEVLRVLDRDNAWPRQGAQRVTWAVPLVKESNGSSVTCEESIIHVLAILSRANVLYCRCGISPNGLGMHIKPY